MAQKTQRNILYLPAYYIIKDMIKDTDVCQMKIYIGQDPEGS